MTTRLLALALLVASPAAGYAQDKAPRPRPAASNQASPPAEGARTVVVDVVLAEFPVNPATPRPEFTGPADEVSARIDDLGKSGTVRRVRLTAVEGREASSTTGGQKPMVSGSASLGPGRPVQRSINYVDVGTTVRVVAHVGADGGVTLDLDLSDSRLGPPASSDEASAIDNAKLATWLNVPAGRAVAAQEVWAEGKDGRTAAVVVVTARVAGK